MVLNSHLCGQTFLLRKLGKLTCLHKFVGEGLLQIDVFPSFHRIHGCGEVGMVRSGNGNRIDLVIEFGKHLPIVLKGGGAFELFGPGIDFPVGIIDIAKTDHFDIAVFGQVGGVNAALSSSPDMGGADFAVGRLGAQAGGQDKEAAHGSRSFDEVSTRCIFHGDSIYFINRYVLFGRNITLPYLFLLRKNGRVDFTLLG